MSRISEFLEAAKEVGNGKKFIGLTPQVFYGGINNPKNRPPTFTEERCINYISIIGGAKGFNYYKYSDSILYPDLRIGMPYLIKEIKSLAPVILNGKNVGNIKSSNTDINTLLLEYNKKHYIFACNVTTNSINAELVLPIETDGLKVISEGRYIKVNKGKVEDKFVPFDVHIYTTDTSYTDVVSLEKVKSEIVANNGYVDYKNYK